MHARGRAWASRVGALGSGLLLLLVIASPARAVVATLTPPYTGATILNSPTTWSTGCGSVSWPPPPVASLTTGNVQFDLHATSCPEPAGTWGSDDTEAGIRATWTATAGGPLTVTWDWTSNYFVKIAETCTSGSVTILFQAFAEIRHSGVVVAGPVSTTLVSVTVPAPGSYSTSVTNYHFTLSLTFAFVNTHVYHFQSWFQGYDKSICGGGPTGASDFGEIDMAHTTPAGSNLNFITVA